MWSKFKWPQSIHTFSVASDILLRIAGKIIFVLWNIDVTFLDVRLKVYGTLKVRFSKSFTVFMALSVFNPP